MLAHYQHAKYFYCCQNVQNYSMKQAQPIMFSQTTEKKKTSTGSDSFKAKNITVLQYFANYKK